MPKQLLLVLLILCLPISASLAQACDIDATGTSAREMLATGNFKGVRNLLHRREDCPFDSSSIQLWLIDFEQNRNRGKERSAREAAQAAQQLLPEDASLDLRLSVTLALAEGHALRREQQQGVALLANCQSLLDQLAEPGAASGRLLYIRGLLMLLDPSTAEAAKAAYREALSILAAYPEQETYIKGYLLRTLGNSAINKGDYPQAENYYLQELALYQRFYPADHFAIAFTHYHAGGAYYWMLDYQKALDQYLQSYEIWKDLPNAEGPYWRYLCEATGDMYWELEDRPNALKFYDLAAQGTSFENKDNGIALSIQGDSLLLNGQAEEALYYYEQALAFREANYGRNHQLTASCQIYVARAKAVAQDSAAALAAFQSAIIAAVPEFQESDPYQNPVAGSHNIGIIPLLEALGGKGRLLLEMAQREQDPVMLQAAAATLNLAVDYLDYLRLSPLSSSAKLFWNQQCSQLLEATMKAQLLLYEQSQEEVYLENAFLLNEKSQSFLLLSALRSEDAIAFAGVPASITTQEQRLRSELLVYEQQLLAEENRCQEASEKHLTLWREQVRKLRTEYDQLVHELEQNYPRYFELKYAAIDNKLAAIQSALQDQNMALLSYFEGKEGLYIYVLTADTLHVSFVDRSSNYSELSQDFVRLLNRPDDFLQQAGVSKAAFINQATSLYRLLVEPALDTLPTSTNRLLIIPGRGLAQIPFGLLLSETPNRQDAQGYQDFSYLLRDYAISYSSSASIWLEGENQAINSTKQSYCGFAAGLVVDTTNRLPALQFSQQEIEGGQEVFGGAIYSGSRATETALRQQDGAILHLATHALIQEDFPMHSSLLLHADSTDDGQLSAYEIYGMNLAAQLVILSACATAQGQWEQSEGQLSLERAFQYAGSPSLLTTLWAVDDLASADLVQFFLQELKAGQPKDVALQQAQLQYLAQADPATAIPYLWGAHRLMGNAEPLSLRSGWSFWWPIGLFLIGGSLLAWRRSISLKPPNKPPLQ